VTRILFLECNGNGGDVYSKDAKTVQDTHGRTSCSEWTGVPLSLLLKEAGVQKGANWLVMQGADPSHHAHSVPMTKALDDALIAYAQNGEPLRLEQGYPLRLIMPGWGGRILMKWLYRIKAVNEPYMPRQEIFLHMDHSPVGPGTWMIAGDKAIAYQFQMYPKSVITFPSGGHKLPGAGFYEITGLAWSGGGVIRRVEVTTDGGRTWKDAQLQEPVLPFAHTRFRFPWNWNGEQAVLQSRCTDEVGDVQPTADQAKEIWGSDTSDACRSVLGDLCNRIPRRTVNAIITTWRVSRDGSVQHVMPLLAKGGPGTPDEAEAEEHH
jgi:sulfane dehydrogenase subunit SoxC